MSLPLSIVDRPLVLGRSPGTPGALLPDERLSRRHAEIIHEADGRWTVRDCNSRNGTFVDGEPVHRSITVAAPRVIRLADTLLVATDDVRDSLPAPPASCESAVIGFRLAGALAEISSAARSSPTLMIRGESGTGKELAARTFHMEGAHAGGPFVAVNCAAIPEGLAERLLFGARRGAYSGAVSDAVGHLQAAHKGVLFLDEVAELDLQVQAKLLRAIETREVVPLGATSGHPVDLRICVATHRDLRAAVAADRFRADLYYRLAPPEVTMPPLRERLDEIPRHVLGEVSDVCSSLAPHVRLLEECMLRAWPGNVRELRKEIRNAAHRAVNGKSERVRVEHLAPMAGKGFPASPSETPAEDPEAALDGRVPRERVGDGKRANVRWTGVLTREQIERALADARGNVASAARSLGMHRTQLYREMERCAVRVNGAGE
jgi:transcriptional regulator with PAS, ATPase and Fis domain